MALYIKFILFGIISIFIIIITNQYEDLHNGALNAGALSPS